MNRIDRAIYAVLDAPWWLVLAVLLLVVLSPVLATLMPWRG